MMPPKASAEHAWLQKLVGDWTVSGEPCGEPGQQAAQDQSSEAAISKMTGRETVRAVGDVWTILEAEMEIPGAPPSRSIMTLGYDPKTERFVGSWIGSIMTYFWGPMTASSRTKAASSRCMPTGRAFQATVAPAHTRT